MTTNLNTLVENFRREVGGTDVAAMSADLITQHLADGLYDIQLDGLLGGINLTTQFATSPYDATTDTTLTGAQQRLVVFYAGCRYITNEIRNTDTRFRAHAGPTEFEVQKSATALVDLLKQLQERKKRLLVQLGATGLPGNTDTFYIDAYSARTQSQLTYPTYFPSG